MRKFIFLVSCILAVSLFACSKQNESTPRATDPYLGVPSTKIPDEIARGPWFTGSISAISYFDRDGHRLGSDYEAGREYVFYNENGKGRIRFWQYLGTRTYSGCVTEIFTRKEGSVVFEGDKFTFYPVKGSFKTIKTGCTSNSVTERKAEADDLKPTVFLWELKQYNGRTLLYTYLETDVNHENPVFVYELAQ